MTILLIIPIINESITVVHLSWHHLTSSSSTTITKTKYIHKKQEKH